MLENRGFGLLVGCGLVLSGRGVVLNGRGVVLGRWGVGRRDVGVLGGRGGILSGGVRVFVPGFWLAPQCDVSGGLW